MNFNDAVGCYYCQKIYPRKEIKEHCDKGKTPLCPHCGVDSVNSFYGALKLLHKLLFSELTAGESEEVINSLTENQYKNLMEKPKPERMEIIQTLARNRKEKK